MQPRRRWIAAMAMTLMAVMVGFSQSAGLTQGRRIQAGGFSFTAPAGWAAKRDLSWALIAPTGDTVVLVTTHNYNDFDSAVRDTKLSEGEVAGTPQDLKGGGKTVRVTKQTPQGIGVIDLFILFSPQGGGVLVTALSDSKNAEAAFYAGRDISSSVTFERNTSSPAAAAGSGWTSRLSGKHLLYLYSGNGYFEEKHIYLCSSGMFYQSTGSGGFTPGNSDGGSFAARGGKRGNWSVSGSVLILQFQDGSVGQYDLTQRQERNEIGMNGRRYFVQSNANCN